MVAIAERSGILGRNIAKSFIPQPSDDRGHKKPLPKGAKALMGTIAAVGTFGSVAWNSATFIPHKGSIINSQGYSDQFRQGGYEGRVRSRYIIEPGWLERNIREPFIQSDRGHFRFLREGILNNAIVASTTSDFFQYLLENKERGNRLTLGEMLESAFSISTEKLRSIDKKDISPSLRDNLPIEAAHIAMYALAGGLGTSWWSERDLNKLGVSIKGYEDVNSFYWHTTGLGTIVFPEIYGVDNFKVDRHLTDHNRSPIYGGADRAVHVGQHMFIVFSYLYAKHFNLPDQETMPAALKLWMKKHGNGKGVDEVRSLPRIIGRAYEASTTRKGITKWFEDRNERITEGFLDEMVHLDLEANELGAKIGIDIWERVINEMTIKDLITELSDPRRFSGMPGRPRITYSYRKAA